MNTTNQNPTRKVSEKIENILSVALSPRDLTQAREEYLICCSWHTSLLLLLWLTPALTAWVNPNRNSCWKRQEGLVQTLGVASDVSCHLSSSSLRLQLGLFSPHSLSSNPSPSSVLECCGSSFVRASLISFESCREATAGTRGRGRLEALVRRGRVTSPHTYTYLFIETCFPDLKIVLLYLQWHLRFCLSIDDIACRTELGGLMSSSVPGLLFSYVLWL